MKGREKAKYFPEIQRGEKMTENLRKAAEKQQPQRISWIRKKKSYLKIKLRNAKKDLSGINGSGELLILGVGVKNE